MDVLVRFFKYVCVHIIHRLGVNNRATSMPRSEQVISIFLASPEELSSERTRLADVVSQWNRAWSRTLGVRLELLRWEDDAYPDIGEDAQDVINRQIPWDWDLFVGLMWSRFGTPTGRAGSGTEEEFDRALERHRTSGEKVGLLFYFKEAPVAPSKLDPLQLQGVQNFKKRVQDTGLLTWDFADADQFEKLIGLHLTKHVQAWRRSMDGSTPISAPSDQVPPAPALNVVARADVASLEVEDHDDAGYLGLLEHFTEKSAEIESIALRLTEAQQRLSDRTIQGKEEIDRLHSDPANASAKKLRAAIAPVAEEMLKYSACVDSEVPQLHAAFDSSMSTLTKLVAVSAELYPEQLTDMKTAITSLLHHLALAREQTAGFRDATAALPKMTKELNVAKRTQVTALNSLVVEFENGESLLVAGLTVINGLTQVGG